jgi:hypothetical protein
MSVRPVAFHKLIRHVPEQYNTCIVQQVTVKLMKFIIGRATVWSAKPSSETLIDKTNFRISFSFCFRAPRLAFSAMNYFPFGYV